jgi:hypothetical protein
MDFPLGPSTPTTDEATSSAIDAPLLSRLPRRTSAVPVLPSFAEDRADLMNDDTAAALLTTLQANGVATGVVPLAPPPPPAPPVAPVDVSAAIARVPDSDIMSTPAELPRIRMVSAEIDYDELSSDEALVAGFRSVIEETVDTEPAPAPPAPPAAMPAVEPADIYAPSADLVQHSVAHQPQRQPAAAPSYATAPLPEPTKAQLKQQRRQARQRTRAGKGSFIGTVLKLAVVLGVLGGGAYAAKLYYFDAKQWDDSAQPIVDEVAAVVGAEFTTPVKIGERPAAEFGRDRALNAFGLDRVTVSNSAAVWRAAGLLQGELSESALAVLGDHPAALGAAETSSVFYDWTAKTIVVREGASETLRTTGLRHALTLALVDQQLPPAADQPTAALARRVYADAVADAVVALLATKDGAAFTKGVADEVAAMSTSAPLVADLPYGHAWAGSAEPLDFALPEDAAPTGAWDDVLAVDIASDGAVFDAYRGLGSEVTVEAPPGSRTMGMLFWFHALAGRMDESVAWSAALAWAGDSTTVTTASAACIDATISAFDEGGALVMKSAFDAWAAAAPTESAATVELSGAKAIRVRSCDPGVVATTAPDNVGVVVGGARSERAALAMAVRADPTLSEFGQQCVVAQVRTLGYDVEVTADQVAFIAAGCR